MQWRHWYKWRKVVWKKSATPKEQFATNEKGGWNHIQNRFKTWKQTRGNIYNMQSQAKPKWKKRECQKQGKDKHKKQPD